MENDGGFGPASGSGIVNNSDYLAQIAPPTVEVKTSPWPKRLLIIAGILAILGGLFFAVYLALSDPRPEIRALATQVDTRIGATSQLASLYQSDLRVSATRTINGELNTFLTNFRRDYALILRTTGGSGADNQVVNILLQPVQAKLDRDYILSNLDRNFPDAMVYQIDLLRAQINALEYRLEAVDQRQLLREADNRLRDIRQQYLDLSAPQ